MQVMKRRPAAVARAKAGDLCGAPSKIQRPQTGRKSSMVEFESAMSAQRNPKRSQRRVVCGSDVEGGSPMPRMRSVRTRTAAKRKVESEVSHTQRTAYCMAAG